MVQQSPQKEESVMKCPGGWIYSYHELHNGDASCKVVALLVYLLTSLGRKDLITAEMKDCNNKYSNRSYSSKYHPWSRLLCSTIQGMTEKQLDKLLYDGKSPMARKLGTWWEEHQAWHEEHAASEREKVRDAESEELTRRFEKLPNEEKRRLLGLIGKK